MPAAAKKQQRIELKGCRENNLKSIDVSLTIGDMICVCGPSGAGKTSLVVNTLYAEGQRRYIESFSTYARQFLERIDKPKLESATGLPPAIAIKAASARKTSSQSNRVTVGSSSEIAEFLRLFFAEAAELICYGCDRPIRKATPESVAARITELEKRRIMVGFETGWDSVTSRAHVLADLQADGFVRIVTGGQELHLTEERAALAALPVKASALVIVDRLRGGASTRATESIEEAFQNGLGDCVLLIDAESESDNPQPGTATEVIGQSTWLREDYNDRLTCRSCEIDYPQSQARLFSYNSPLGACPTCEGFGNTVAMDPKLVVPDPDKSLQDGAVAPWNTPSYQHFLDAMLDAAESVGLPVDVPYRKLTKRQQRVVLEGDENSGIVGVEGFFAYLQRKKYKMHVRVFLSRWNSYSICDACDGKRLSPAALSYVCGPQQLSFADLCNLSIAGLLNYLREFPKGTESYVSPLRHTIARLETLIDLGLDYLRLNRPMRTLSTGEAQRVAMSTVLGSTLVNVLYVLDEPARGLHSADVQRLSDAARRVALRGNTLAIVEHHPALVLSSDSIVELGPGAGEEGGNIEFQGTPVKSNARNCQSLAHALGTNRSQKRPVRRTPSKWIQLKGCNLNNLKDLDIELPMGVLCCITGVSGSGKSSLISQTLAPGLELKLAGRRLPKDFPLKTLQIPKELQKVTVVDQQPIGKSPRSNPATFTKVFEGIRKLFASTPQARMLNLTPGHFSFNSANGRCSHCGGDGSLEVDMHFLADVRATCPVCKGSRFNTQVLQARYRDKTIAEVLNLSASEGIRFFRGEPELQATLSVLEKVGLGYLKLGQPAPTLSSGEAQRLKLATHLKQAAGAESLLILDEPCMGLHPIDTARILECLRTLVDGGTSVVMIEHSLQLVSSADYIIDLGPGPSELGGRQIAFGTPEEIRSVPESVTGRFLRDYMAATKNKK